jgi:hypothetical protein
MTNFLHWRKMTWALVLWSGYVPTWAVVTGSGPAMVMLWWLVGMIVFGSLWLVTQPLFQKGRGLTGCFVRPGWTDWRVVNLHRNHRSTELGRDAG